MPKYAVCERRGSMKFHAAGPFVEAATLADFMARPETARTIRLNEKFGDTWKVVQYTEDDALPHVVVHEGTSGGRA